MIKLVKGLSEAGFPGPVAHQELLSTQQVVSCHGKQSLASVPGDLRCSLPLALPETSPSVPVYHGCLKPDQNAGAARTTAWTCYRAFSPGSHSELPAFPSTPLMGQQNLQMQYTFPPPGRALPSAMPLPTWGCKVQHQAIGPIEASLMLQCLNFNGMHLTS